MIPINPFEMSNKRSLETLLRMCEHYLNKVAPRATSIYYYTGLRQRLMKELLELQIAEFDRS